MKACHSQSRLHSVQSCSKPSVLAVHTCARHQRRCNRAHAAASVPALSLQRLKSQLVADTAGLDRGLASTEDQRQRVAATAAQLEAQAQTVILLPNVLGSAKSSKVDLFSGTWRLLYSSAFGQGNLGGSRPGPPAALSPIKLGAIYQRIDGAERALDNIVDIEPQLPLPFQQSDQPPALRACLAHSFTISDGNNVRIVYQSTSAEPIIGSERVEFFGAPLRIEPPAVQQLLPEDFRAASFRVTFLDEELRVTRGDRGELRVYQRAPVSTLSPLE